MLMLWPDLCKKNFYLCYVFFFFPDRQCEINHFFSRRILGLCMLVWMIFFQEQSESDGLGVEVGVMCNVIN